jgi:hypothetical protein
METEQGWKTVFSAGRVLRESLREQRDCIADAYGRLSPYLDSPADTPPAYTVYPEPVPSSFYSWRRNIFSTLFHSMYLLLDIPEARRQLYGRLIHLFRIWVTSADNLLDEEDKVVVPLHMPGSSRIMRQVVTLMAADRVLAELLAEAVATGLISAAAAANLSRASLQRLLPSAAQEATEEGGVQNRPDPETVLRVIHPLKTGLLFNIAFVGPELLEPDLNRPRAARLKSSLLQFGLGCQLLDDIRDLSRDLLESRHNYVLSVLAFEQPDLLDLLRKQAKSPTDRLYLSVPQQVLPAARRGFGLMRDGLQGLGSEGLGCNREEAGQLADAMFGVLDLEGLEHV